MNKIIFLLCFLWVLLAIAGGMMIYTTWYPQTQTGQEITIYPETGETFTIDSPVKIKGTSGDKIVFSNLGSGEKNDYSMPFVPGTFTVESTLNPGVWSVEGGHKAVLVITAERNFTVITTTSQKTKGVTGYMVFMIFILIPVLIGFIWYSDKYILKRNSK